MIQPVYFNRSDFVYVQIPENQIRPLILLKLCTVVCVYRKLKIFLTTPRSRRGCFSVFRLISPWYSGPRFRCTCTSVDNSCHQDNPDRCHLQFNNDRCKINQLYHSKNALGAVGSTLYIGFTKTILRSIC